MVMETNYSKPLITVCSETPIQQKKLTRSVNNVVLFFSYGDRSHFSEKCATFFSYENRSHFSEQRGTFFQLWRQITQAL